MLLKNVWFLSAAAVVCSGCLGTSRYTNKSEVVYKEDLLRETAGFDFNCKPNDLEVSSIGNIAGATVVGCGQRGRYVFNGNTQLWIANTSTK